MSAIVDTTSTVQLCSDRLLTPFVSGFQPIIAVCANGGFGGKSWDIQSDLSFLSCWYQKTTHLAPSDRSEDIGPDSYGNMPPATLSARQSSACCIAIVAAGTRDSSGILFAV